MRSTQTCLYRILEVEPGASHASVEQAYRRLSQIFGPTSLAVYGLVDEAEQKRMLDAIEEAFRTLGDPEARAAYDRDRGHPPPEDEPAPAAVESAADFVFDDDEIEVIIDDDFEIVEASEAEEAPRIDAAPVEAGPQEKPPAPAAPAVAPPGTGTTREEAAEAPPPLPPMPPLDADTTYTGDLLRAVREARGLSLQQIAARTRITATHLENIELERYDWLPERVFLRGFLISFARELKLDPNKVAETYLARRDGSR